MTKIRHVSSSQRPRDVPATFPRRRLTIVAAVTDARVPGAQQSIAIAAAAAADTPLTVTTRRRRRYHQCVPQYCVHATFSHVITNYEITVFNVLRAQPTKNWQITLQSLSTRAILIMIKQNCALNDNQINTRRKILMIIWVLELSFQRRLNTNSYN